MAQFWEPKSAGTELRINREQSLFRQSDDLARKAVLDDYQGLSTATRTDLAGDLGFASLEEFDADMEEEESELQDRLDYYDYDTRVVNLTVADGAWFSPDSVESFCGEEVGQEAFRMIDGNAATFWRHSTDEQHIITFLLRDYPKKIERFRILYGSGESARERLNDIEIRAAKGLANLNNPENVLESEINIFWPTGISVDTWVEHTLAKKKLKARYIRVEIGNTDNGQNQAQIREIQFWVGTRQPEDTDTE